MENRDIGSMIGEELEGEKPSAQGSEPLPADFGSLTVDERMRLKAEHAKPTEHAAKERQTVLPPAMEPTRRAKPASIELAKMGDENFDEEVRVVRAERARLTPEQSKTLSAHEISLITDLVRQTVEADSHFKTAIMEEGIAATDFASSSQPFQEGLRVVTEAVLHPGGDIMRKAPRLFESDADAEKVRRALVRDIESAIIAHVTESVRRRKAERSTIETVRDEKSGVRQTPRETRHDAEAMRNVVGIGKRDPRRGWAVPTEQPKRKSFIERLKFWKNDDEKKAA